MLSVMICAIMLIAIAFVSFLLGGYLMVNAVAKDDPETLKLVAKYRAKQRK